MKRRNDSRAAAAYWLFLLTAGLLSGCGDESTAFQITSVEIPTSVQSDGPRGTLTVSWTGSATFPVELVYRPRAGGCPPDLECFTAQRTFPSEESPLVFPESVWCMGVTTTVVFGYEVVLTDANDVETAAFTADFTCEAGPT
jgi:hypothetical protein